MQERVPLSLTVSVVLLITGNLVGAGILALPVNTGLAGFVPSLLCMLVCGGAMFFSAVVLGNEATRMREPTFNYPSLYEAHLGAVGKWVAIAANLLILYGLLTAYLAGATTIIHSLLRLPVSGSWVLLVFFLLTTGLAVRGIRTVGRYNAVLMVLMWASFGIIVLMAERRVEWPRLARADWGFLPAAVPIVVAAFHFHNIIPNVCQRLRWNASAVWRVMLVGMSVGYLMNAVWIQVGIGALSLHSIAGALEKGQPSTVLLGKEIHSSLFFVGSMVFALMAISTSYLSNGVGLMGFVQDLMTHTFKKSSPPLNIALAFGPPLLISLVYPDIFLQALNVVGGVGIVVLFGILPSTLAVSRATSPARRALAVLVLLLFVSFLLLEFAQELGLLQIKAEVEYWRHNVGQ